MGVAGIASMMLAVRGSGRGIASMMLAVRRNGKGIASIVLVIGGWRVSPA
ncbi:MAG: hypothetical protein Kow0063_08770 [Anaerolineae bacterium]